MFLKAPTTIILVGLYAAYRLIIVGRDFPSPDVRDVDIFALLAALSVAWLVQLFKDYPSLRQLRWNRSQKLGLAPQELVAILLAGVLGASLFPAAEMAHNFLTGSTFSPGIISASAVGSLIPSLLLALVFLVPSVRKGGIWVDKTSQDSEENK